MSITQSFKDVFISQKNSGYLFELIIKKILQSTPHYKKYIIEYIETYKSNIIDLQTFIFEDSFANIYNEMKNRGPINLEEILILLNKITVIKFENMLINDLNKKYDDDETNTIDETNEIEIRANEIRANEIRANEIRTNEIRANEINTNHLQLNYQQTNESNSKNNVEINNERILSIKQLEDKNERHGNDFTNEVYLDNTDIYSTRSNDQLTSELCLNNTSTCFYHFFSKDAIFQDNKYHYQLNIKNVKSINLDSIKVLCNMYNISEYNNKLYLIEQNSKILITIPVGYYSIDQLLNITTTLFNNVSINKNKDYKYNAYLNNVKNKIYFTCELNEKEKFKRNITFGISFSYDKYPKNKNGTFSLQEIMGFNKTEYMNNTIYISENSPNTNIFQELYFKLYINNIELKKYNTSRDSFTYYECLDINMEKEFGKTLHFSYDYNPYDIYNKNFNIETISLEFRNSNMNYLNNQISFNTIFSFEYLTES